MMKRCFSVILVVLLIVCVSFPAFSQEEKPELTFNGIPLRITVERLKEILAGKGVVPYYEFDSKVNEKKSYEVTYYFDENFAGYPVKTGYAFCLVPPHGKNSPYSSLARTVALYDGWKDSEETFQAVYDNLLQYLVESYGDNYTVQEDEVIWNDFRNSNDELKLNVKKDHRNILLIYTAEDQWTVVEANIALNKAFGWE